MVRKGMEKEKEVKKRRENEKRLERGGGTRGSSQRRVVLV